MLDHLEQLLVAEDIATIWSMHCTQMARFGFDRLIYGFTRFSATQSFGSLDDTLILSNHDPAYLNAFLGAGLFSDAPMVKWAIDSVGACSWRMVAEKMAAGELTEGERKVIELNRRFQVLAGYSIGFPDTSARAKGAIGLCAKPGLTQADVDAIWQEHGRAGAEFDHASENQRAALFDHASPADRAPARSAGMGRRRQDLGRYRADSRPDHGHGRKTSAPCP